MLTAALIRVNRVRSSILSRYSFPFPINDILDLVTISHDHVIDVTNNVTDNPSNPLDNLPDTGNSSEQSIKTVTSKIRRINYFSHYEMYDIMADRIETASISLVGHIVARYRTNYLVKSQRLRRRAYLRCTCGGKPAKCILNVNPF